MIIKFFWICTIFSALVSGARVPGAISQFEFSREECLKGYFSDSAPNPTIGLLSRNKTLTRCLKGNGVALHSGRPVESTVPIQSAPLSTFLRALNATNTFTIDFWMEVDETEGGEHDIALFSLSYLSEGTYCDSALRVSSSQQM